ncbi:MAG TPA: M23 family metallopeptidase [Anaeromyxobacter sp.]|nr:M23 family metallopeptidase [Anaeromyxobacter sp.]
MLAPALAALLALVALQAPPSVVLVPSAARPGDAVLVRVTGAAVEPHGTLAGRPLSFWAAGGAEWRALAALPIETAPGQVPVRIEAEGPELEAALTVVEPRFTSHAISLDKKYVEPPRSVQKRIAADHKAFARAFSHPFAPPLFVEGFDWPRRAPTSGRFGDQRILNGKKASVHYGLDITGPRGAPVAAAADGEVVIARDAYLSGNTVVIWHGAGVYTAYFHLDRMAVAAGQRVRRGQQIGALGSTGRATGPHLHWGVKVDGLYVDPESILAIDFAGGSAPPRSPGEPPRAAPRSD